MADNENKVTPETVTTETEPKAEEMLAALQAECADLRDKNLRLLADFENFRRRNLEDRSQWIKNATQRLVLELIEVMDNFERALDSGRTNPSHDSLLSGVEMIFKQLENLLGKEGVQKIEALGKDFDPAFCEAVAQIPSKYKKDKVAAVIKNGYLMNDKLIRPVQCAVANGVKPNKKDKE